MSISRYRYSRAQLFAPLEYYDLLTKRDKMSGLVMYGSTEFKDMKVRDVMDVTIDTHTWRASDRFYKLAYQYYGDATYWWVIALYNNKPLESDIQLGETILIPTPLETIIAAMEK